MKAFTPIANENIIDLYKSLKQNRGERIKHENEDKSAESENIRKAVRDKLVIGEKHPQLPPLYNKAGVMDTSNQTGTVSGSLHFELFFSRTTQYNASVTAATDSGTQNISLSYEKKEELSLSMDFNFIMNYREGLPQEEKQSFDVFLNSKEFFDLAHTASDLILKGKDNLNAFDAKLTKFFDKLSKNLNIPPETFDSAKETFIDGAEKLIEFSGNKNQLSLSTGDNNETVDNGSALIPGLPEKLAEVIEDIRKSLNLVEKIVPVNSSPSFEDTVMKLIDTAAKKIEEISQPEDINPQDAAA